MAAIKKNHNALQYIKPESFDPDELDNIIYFAVYKCQWSRYYQSIDHRLYYVKDSLKLSDERIDKIKSMHLQFMKRAK
jgi:hypothetical protein